MKRLLLFLFLLPCLAWGQQTYFTTAPSGSNPATLTYRSSGTDSLRSFYLFFSGAYNQFYTAAQSNNRYLKLTGGTLSGTLTVQNGISSTNNDRLNFTAGGRNGFRFFGSTGSEILGLNDNSPGADYIGAYLYYPLHLSYALPSPTGGYSLLVKDNNNNSVAYIPSTTIDNTIAQHEINDLYANASTSSTNIYTSPSLQGVILTSVFRSGLDYQPTVSTSPNDNEYNFNSTTGTVKFGPNFSNTTAEKLHFKYKYSGGTSAPPGGPVFYHVATYAAMTALVSSGWQEFLVDSDTVYGGGLSTRYYYLNGVQVSYVIN